jgi:hypothetical protein
METLDEIIQEYLDDFSQKKAYGFVVKPSIPTVWFGNLEKYRSSKGRILTVALNPSFQEFPIGAAPRFNLNAATPKDLSATLNRYFLDNPYEKWFEAFEFVLNRLNATYYEANDQLPRTAIHIDIYSAIATNPTWGKLTSGQQRQLSRTDLFSKLLSALDPDLIVFSGNIRIFKEVFTSASLVLERRFKNNGYIREYSHDGRMLVTGLNYKGQPFGGMSRAEKSTALEDINRHFEQFIERKPH